MDVQTQSIPFRRRSDRVSIVFPIEVSGIDLAGDHFCDKTHTTTVSRYGCCVSLRRKLPLKHQLSLYRPSTDERTMGLVAAQMAAHSDGYFYGVSTGESCEGMWGIRFSSSFQEKLLDCTNDGVYFVNRNRQITYWNGGAERLTGYSTHEAVGKSCFCDFLADVDGTGKSLCAGGCPLSSAMDERQPKQLDFYVRHKSGHRLPVSARVLPTLDNSGAVIGAVQVFTDNSAKALADQRVRELETLAFRDPLTQLSNRRYMQLKVAQALEDHEQFGREYGLLLIDLDRFKQVNDTHGHDIGDAILKVVAETLEHTVRTMDHVGRWGGEEFLVLMTGVNAIGLGDLAERCRVMIAQSCVRREASRVSVTASIGATLLSHGDSAERAIRRADELMYQSKRSGGDRTTTG